MNYVYILEFSKDNGFYVGCTEDLKLRMEKHTEGKIVATRDWRPVELLCYFALKNKYQAFNFEKVSPNSC